MSGDSRSFDVGAGGKRYRSVLCFVSEALDEPVDTRRCRPSFALTHLALVVFAVSNEDSHRPDCCHGCLPFVKFGSL